MSGIDIAQNLRDDLAGAFGLLTRLPFGGPGRGAASCWAWGPTGAAVAALAVGAGAGAMALGVPVTVAAGLVLAVQAALTGALHEDGLADTCDGLLGGRTPERRMEIMRDSRIGAFGALGLMLSVLIRWAALVAVLAVPMGWAMVIGVSALSRGAMAGVMAALPPARPDGLSQHQGRPTFMQAGAALAVAGVIALPALGLALLPVVALGLVAVTALAIWARARIGGQTGDILGATQQVAEIAALIVLSVLVGQG
jgi:adenosylcobinamide-GDP ribazoletransferase